MATPFRSSAVVLALAAVLLAPPAVGSPLPQGRGRSQQRQRPERLEYFDGTLEQAFEACRERNVPLVILCVLEKEEANDRYRDELKNNASLAEKLGKAVVLLVNNGRHASTEIRVRGPDGKRVEREVCSAYHCSTCEVHRRNWDAVYQTFVATQKQGLWALPEAIVALPDRSIHARISSGEPPADSAVISGARAAASKLGPGLSREELVEVKRLAEEGRRMGRASAWGDSWRAWDALLAIAQAGPFTDEGKQGCKQAEAGLRAELAEVEEALGLEGEAAQRACRDLVELARDGAGTPVAKGVSTLLGKARRNPELKPWITRATLEVEAEALLEEALEHLRQGEEKKARALVKKLTGKKYGDTAAAARARELRLK